MRLPLVCLAFVPLLACRPGEAHNAFGDSTPTGDASTDSTTTGDDETGDDADGSSEGSEDTDGYKFDLGATDLLPTCDEGGLFPHAPCEDGMSLDRALGIGAHPCRAHQVPTRGR